MPPRSLEHPFAATAYAPAAGENARCALGVVVEGPEGRLDRVHELAVPQDPGPHLARFLVPRVELAQRGRQPFPRVPDRPPGALVGPGVQLREMARARVEEIRLGGEVAVDRV